MSKSLKHLYINTMGCQMNVYDSEKIVDGLRSLGYNNTSSLEKADLVIVNTCSIREKAEQKAFSFLGRLTRLKQKKPGMIIGVGGCIAQQEGKKILKRAPAVDIVFGTHAVNRLPGLIKKLEKNRLRIVDVDMSEEIIEFEPDNEPACKKDISCFVTIMRGCDNYCSYCVVPYVRGRETSRRPESIIKEIEGLVENGATEVTLLGQNVNSYGKKEGLITFPELLARVNEIEGLSRIRFTTSHPKDFSDELMHAFRDIEKLCRHIHLPVQSGSNRILKRMNRKYTKEMYLQKIEAMRGICPDIAVTSDMIVGFPGETRADFEETLDLMKTVEFDGLFAFAYSDRPNAAAAGFADKVSEKEKNKRLRELLDLQEEFTKKKNQALVGNIETVLVEGFSKKQTMPDSGGAPEEAQWTGRTSTNKIVNFSPVPESEDGFFENMVCIGKLIDVKIDHAHSHSITGKPVRIDSHDKALRGDNNYAA